MINQLYPRPLPFLFVLNTQEPAFHTYSNFLEDILSQYSSYVKAYHLWPKEFGTETDMSKAVGYIDTAGKMANRCLIFGSAPH